MSHRGISRSLYLKGSIRCLTRPAGGDVIEEQCIFYCLKRTAFSGAFSMSAPIAPARWTWTTWPRSGKTGLSPCGSHGPLRTPAARWSTARSPSSPRRATGGGTRARRGGAAHQRAQAAGRPRPRLEDNLGASSSRTIPTSKSSSACGTRPIRHRRGGIPRAQYPGALGADRTGEPPMPTPKSSVSPHDARRRTTTSGVSDRRHTRHAGNAANPGRGIRDPRSVWPPAPPAPFRALAPVHTGTLG